MEARIGTAAPPSLTAALNASGLSLNASLAFGNSSAFERHEFASGLLQTLLAQLPTGAHLLDAAAASPACPAARNASLDHLLPPVASCSSRSVTNTSSRARRRRRLPGTLHLLQADAVGEGSDAGGNFAAEDIEFEAADSAGSSQQAAAAHDARISAFSMDVSADQGQISGLYGCCQGLADNIRPTIPIRWSNVPYGSDSLFLLVDDMDFSLMGISFPLVLAIIPDIDYHAELADLRSAYTPPNYDVTGLWRSATTCLHGCSSWWTLKPQEGAQTSIQPGQPPGYQKVDVASYYAPGRTATVDQVGPQLSTGTASYDVGMGPAIGVRTLSAPGSPGYAYKRVPCALRFKLFIVDWASLYPQWFPRSSGCTFKVEAGSPYDGNYREVFSRHFRNGWWKEGVGQEYLVDMSDFLHQKTDVRFTMEGSSYHSRPWWYKFFDWCIVEKPQMFCEDTVTYDFASSLHTATTTIAEGGHDFEPGRGRRFQDIAKDGWAGWAWQSQGYFYQNNVAGWLGRPALLSLPVFSPYGRAHGAIRTQWSLLESALPAQFRGPQENKGLGGARSIGAAGARAPCPLDGRRHRIRFRLYARTGSTTSVRYEPDKTSGDEVNHELNLDPATLAVASAIVETEMSNASCSTPYAIPQPR